MPATFNKGQKALAGKPLEEVVRSGPVIRETILAPESTKVIKLNGGRVSIVDAIHLFGWISETRFVWLLDRSLITLLAQENGKLEIDASNRILIPMNLTTRNFEVHRWFKFIAGLSTEFSSQTTL